MITPQMVGNQIVSKSNRDARREAFFFKLEIGQLDFLVVFEDILPRLCARTNWRRVVRGLSGLLYLETHSMRVVRMPNIGAVEGAVMSER